MTRKNTYEKNSGYLDFYQHIDAPWERWNFYGKRRVPNHWGQVYHAA